MTKETLASFKSRVRDRRAHVAVIGLGYVGLPLAVEFAQAGFSVTGIDVDEKKVKNVNRGVSHIADIDSGDNATDFVVLEVPTPGSAPLSGIPEPSSALLAGMGLLGLLAAGRRPRRA